MSRRVRLRSLPMRISALVLPSALTAMIFAGCGSDTPSTGDIRNALDNPTGSVNDKGGVTAATQRQQSSGANTSFGAATPFGGGALTLARTDHKAALDPMTSLAPMFKHAERRFARPIATKQLRTAQELGGLESCFSDAFNTDMIDPTSDSIDLSFDIDFDRCGDGTITGKMSVSMSAEIDRGTNEMRYDASYDYSNLCVKSEGIEVCQDGSMNIEGNGQFGAQDFTMEMIAAWKYTVSISAGDKSYSFSNKGGIEMKLGEESANIRMAVFVTLPDGEEVSYTFTLNANANGGSFEIAGRDGKLTCTVDSDGNGSCTGDVDLEWTESEWDDAYTAYGE